MSYDKVAVSDLRMILGDVDIYGSRIVPGKKNILSGGRHLLSDDRRLIYPASVDITIRNEGLH